MISQTSDPDIETIYSRINRQIYDLQPDFQRGEVWDTNKKRKLVDSILREWHIPPIHLVYVKSTGTHEVLDGQQRLVAIRDFINNEFSINGKEIPYNEDIEKLNGLKFKELPSLVQNRFMEYTIRVFVIKEYTPEEPGELFYRLNQSTTLSPAEQRNSFYGTPRNQIKYLTSYMQEKGLDRRVLGFSNARMAHDDMIAKVCFTLENETFRKPASSKNITAKYRSGEPFSNKAIEEVKNSIDKFSECQSYFKKSLKLNKSTMYSMLCFIAQIEKLSPKIPATFLGKFLYNFETAKNTPTNIFSEEYKTDINKNTIESLLNIYNDRASYRAENISSIKLRDLILWVFLFLAYEELKYSHSEIYSKLSILMSKVGDADSEAESAILLEDYLEFEWGEKI